MAGYLDEALYYAKGIAGLVAAVATSLLTVFGADTEVGKWLTVAVAVAGAITVYAVPNRRPAGDELVDPDGTEIIGAEDEDVEYADEYVADLENPEPGGGRRIKGEG